MRLFRIKTLMCALTVSPMVLAVLGATQSAFADAPLPPNIHHKLPSPLTVNFGEPIEVERAAITATIPGATPRKQIAEVILKGAKGDLHYGEAKLIFMEDPNLPKWFTGKVFYKLVFPNFRGVPPENSPFKKSGFVAVDKSGVKLLMTEKDIKQYFADNAHNVNNEQSAKALLTTVMHWSEIVSWGDRSLSDVAPDRTMVVEELGANGKRIKPFNAASAFIPEFDLQVSPTGTIKFAKY